MPKATTGSARMDSQATARESALVRAEALIRGKAERVTRARVEILAVLLSSPVALSHQKIIAGLKKSRAAIDRVTVYRNLDWLVSEQLAHRVASESRAWHYGSIVGTDDHTDHAHAHFECRRCEKLYCIESSPPAESASLPSGFKLEQANVKFEGLCARCNKHSGDRSEKAS